jgi:hypothetical protein
MCKDCSYFKEKGDVRCFICGEWFDSDTQLKYDPQMSRLKEKYPHGYIDNYGNYIKNDW